MEHAGRPARELDDDALARQGTHAHATRNWVFLHGTTDQFRSHTERMLELEQEYLRRHPKRTWQGAADGTDTVDEATRLRAALRGLVTQVEALLADSPASEESSSAPTATIQALLREVEAGPGGRLHRLEVHQAARRNRVNRAALANLYKGAAPLLRADGADRVLTDAGRAAMNEQEETES